MVIFFTIMKSFLSFLFNLYYYAYITPIRLFSTYIIEYFPIELKWKKQFMDYTPITYTLCTNQLFPFFDKDIYRIKVTSSLNSQLNHHILNTLKHIQIEYDSKNTYKTISINLISLLQLKLKNVEQKFLLPENLQILIEQNKEIVDIIDPPFILQMENNCQEVTFQSPFVHLLWRGNY